MEADSPPQLTRPLPGNTDWRSKAISAACSCPRRAGGEMQALIQAAQEYAGKAGLEERLAAASVLQQQVLACCPKAIGSAVQGQTDPTVSRGPGGLGVAAAHSPGLTMRPACPVAAGWKTPAPSSGAAAATAAAAAAPPAAPLAQPQPRMRSTPCAPPTAPPSSAQAYVRAVLVGARPGLTGAAPTAQQASELTAARLAAYKASLARLGGSLEGPAEGGDTAGAGSTATAALTEQQAKALVSVLDSELGSNTSAGDLSDVGAARGCCLRGAALPRGCFTAYLFRCCAPVVGA
jgi:hypothetical protein